MSPGCRLFRIAQLLLQEPSSSPGVRDVVRMETCSDDVADVVTESPTTGSSGRVEPTAKRYRVPSTTATGRDSQAVSGSAD